MSKIPLPSKLRDALIVERTVCAGAVCDGVVSAGMVCAGLVSNGVICNGAVCAIPAETPSHETISIANKVRRIMHAISTPCRLPHSWLIAGLNAAILG